MRKVDDEDNELPWGGRGGPDGRSNEPKIRLAIDQKTKMASSERNSALFLGKGKIRRSEVKDERIVSW